MTSSQMLAKFRLDLDDGAFSAPSFEDSDIYSFLNDSQLKLVEGMVSQTGILGLEELSRLAILTPTVLTPYAKMWYVTLDEPALGFNFLMYVESYSKITKSFPSITPASWVLNKLTTKDLSSRFIQTPLNSPLFDTPITYKDYFEVGVGTGTYKERLVIIGDTYTTLSTSEPTVRLTYLKYPVDIATLQNCELNENLHQKLIDVAVKLATDSLIKDKQQ